MEKLIKNSERLVHLDMKGAPPKISYFEKLVPMLVKWGATGILLEWEDTFPYCNDLSDLGGLSARSINYDDPYSSNDAQNLISIIKRHGLNLIPLIQTFGHLEFLLKHQKWYNLRELEKYPSSICPSHPETLPVIKEMLSQVISFHKDLKYIHIGCDEVWHMSLCENCSKVNNPDNRHHLFLNHLSIVSQFLKMSYPHITIIIWDDMIRSIPVELLKEYNIGNLVEIMVWCYLPKDIFHIGPSIWEKYKLIFQNTWIASAFKGATSSCQIIPDKKYHLSNHQAWLEEIYKYWMIMPSFKGIAFTGWSRFDHYATLCELLPVGLPSLVLCMKTWLNSGYSPEILESVENELGFNMGTFKLEFFEYSNEMQSLNYPGYQVSIIIEDLFKLRHRVNTFMMSDLIQTWLNSWQIENNYTNPMQLENLLSITHTFLQSIPALETNLNSVMSEVFFSSTVKEFCGTIIEPMKKQLLQLKQNCETQIFLPSNLRALKP